MTPGGRAAVFGRPIGHSKSPALHRAAYAALRLDISYEPIDAGADDADALARRLRTEPGWRGASVTMPLKHAMVPLMDSVSARVGRLGALNTIVVGGAPGHPTLRGENTDVEGIVRALNDAGARGVRRVAILGAGGTATAATEAASLLGARSVDFAVRSLPRAAGCLALADRLGLAAEAIDPSEAGLRMPGYDAVISTLPAGAADPLLPVLRVDSIRPGTALLDVIYDPWPSELARSWEAAGGRVAGGLSMLVHQAVEQVRLFTGGGERDWAGVTNVMCDAVGLPRPAA
ncbi:shikimate dehydrogenase family protein [Arthrobacter halodurans]|uniref:Shikimate dehydrogenase n=1 Tax=Arthrobacter halodurans TaxID=516699 RepID=A0ABV4UN85_9MICC